MKDLENVTVIAETKTRFFWNWKPASRL